MANGSKFESQGATQAEEVNTVPTEDTTSKFDKAAADQVDNEYNYIAGNADSWFSIVQDPTTGGYGIEVPDIDFSFAKFDEEEEDDTPAKRSPLKRFTDWMGMTK